MKYLSCDIVELHLSRPKNPEYNNLGIFFLKDFLNMASKCKHTVCIFNRIVKPPFGF